MSKGIVRIAEQKDVPEILAIYTPFIEHTAVSFEMKVPTVEEFWQCIQNVLEEDAWLVYELDGKIAGYAYASAHRKRVAYQWTREISAYLGEEFRGQGIGTKLYNFLIDLLVKQGYKNLLAGITVPNPASVALHQKMGFEMLGRYKRVGYKFGAYHDVIWLQMPIGDDSPPKEIVHWRNYL